MTRFSQLACDELLYKWMLIPRLACDLQVIVVGTGDMQACSQDRRSLPGKSRSVTEFLLEMRIIGIPIMSVNNTASRRIRQLRGSRHHFGQV